MPVDEGSLLQTPTTGAVTNSTSWTVTVSSTTAGSDVVVAITAIALVGVTAPSGFAAIYGPLQLNGGTHFAVYRKHAGPGSETSWGFTAAAAVIGDWTAYEVDGLAAGAASAIATNSVVGGQTLSTGNTAGNTSYNCFALALHAVQSAVPPATAAMMVWHDQTNGFTEDSDYTALTSGGTNRYGWAASHRFTTTLGPWSCTATTDTTSLGFPGAVLVLLPAADSQITAPVVWCSGFGYQTTTGLTAGNAGARLLDAITGTAGTNVILETANARAGSGPGNLKLVASAATVNAQVTTATFSAGRDCGIFAGYIKPVSGTGVVTLAALSGSSGAAWLQYDFTNQMFGMSWAGAFSVWQANGAAPTGSYYLVEARVTGMTSTSFHVDWRVDGVDQTPPADLSTTASSLATFYLGSASSATYTACYTDFLLSVTPVAYPLGGHSVKLLTVDPAGTLTITGTSGNFQTFTANGTLAAWNATTARGAIDEVPPDISGTADGIVQITAATGDYVEVPMQTYALSSTEVLTAVRMLAAGWATSGTAATLGFRAFTDAEVTLQAGTVDPAFDNATTTAWVAKMVDPEGGWIQSRLDALAFRVGYSSDATPDVGIHAIYAEAAVGAAKVARMLEAEGGAFAVDVRVNPYSAAYLSMLVTVPATRGASWNYSVNGTPQNPAPVAAGATAVEVVTTATAFGEISDVQLFPDPTS